MVLRSQDQDNLFVMLVIQNQITLMNQKWIRFITSQYIEFIKNHNWITDIMDYNSEIKIENEDEYSKSLKIKEAET